MTSADLEHLRATADDAIQQIYRLWSNVRQRPRGMSAEVHSLGWMETDAYLALAERSLQKKVLAPLRARGIMAAG